MRQIFLKSAREVWRDKRLWILGIFVSLLGVFEEADFLRHVLATKYIPSWSFIDDLSSTGIFSRQGMNGLLKLSKTEPIIFSQLLLLGIFILAIAGFLLWLSLVSQGAMVRHIASDTHHDSGIKKILKPGARYFWPILFSNIFTKASLVFLYWLTIELITPQSLFTYSIAASLILVIYITLSVSFRYGICGIIVKNQGFFRSVKNAWSTLAQFPLESFSQALALLALYIATLLVITLLAAVALIPFLFIILATYFMKLPALTAAAFFAYFSTVPALFLILYGFFSAFSWYSWVQLYSRLHRH